MRAQSIIAKCLGAFWIFDGLLQLQPQMFGENFVTNVLVPNLSDQPHFMQAIVAWGISAWSANMIASDVAATLLQIAIGILLFFPLSNKWCRIGLWVSIVWGIVVWFCGEGAGLFLTGVASFYTGAPGAVLIYVLLAALLLIPQKISVAAYPKILGWILIAGSALQLQSAFWTLDGAQGAFMNSMMDAVHPLSVLPDHLYTVVGLNPVLANMLLVAALLIAGLALLLKPNKITAIIVLVFLFFVWWFGQDFGQLSTLIVGTPTDPNTAPLLVLLLIPLLLYDPGQHEKFAAQNDSRGIDYHPQAR